jgi:hypothetical protein
MKPDKKIKVETVVIIKENRGSGEDYPIRSVETIYDMKGNFVGIWSDEDTYTCEDMVGYADYCIKQNKVPSYETLKQIYK